MVFDAPQLQLGELPDNDKVFIEFCSALMMPHSSRLGKATAIKHNTCWNFTPISNLIPEKRYTFPG